MGKAERIEVEKSCELKGKRTRVENAIEVLPCAWR